MAAAWTGRSTAAAAPRSSPNAASCADPIIADGLPAGQAVATTAGELDARWVIHTVGPVYSARDDRSAVLASCYAQSLRVADELGARTVAFPAVSAGIYGWPAEAPRGSR